MWSAQAQEFNSIEHLEAAQFAQSYTKPQYNTYAQVRGSKSLYFHNENKSRTWNQQDTRHYRKQSQTEYCPGYQKRLSVSSFRYVHYASVYQPQELSLGFRKPKYGPIFRNGLVSVWIKLSLWLNKCIQYGITYGISNYHSYNYSQNER